MSAKVGNLVTVIDKRNAVDSEVDYQRKLAARRAVRLFHAVIVGIVGNVVVLVSSALKRAIWQVVEILFPLLIDLGCVKLSVKDVTHGVISPVKTVVGIAEVADKLGFSTLVKKDKLRLQRTDTRCTLTPEIEWAVIADIKSVAVNIESLHKISHVFTQILAELFVFKVNGSKIITVERQTAILVALDKIGVLVNHFSPWTAVHIYKVEHDLKPKRVCFFYKAIEVGIVAVFGVYFKIITNAIAVFGVIYARRLLTSAPIVLIHVIIRQNHGAEINEIGACGRYVRQLFLCRLKRALGCKGTQIHLIHNRFFPPRGNRSCIFFHYIASKNISSSTV